MSQPQPQLNYTVATGCAMPAEDIILDDYEEMGPIPAPQPHTAEQVASNILELMVDIHESASEEDLVMNYIFAASYVVRNEEHARPFLRANPAIADQLIALTNHMLAKQPTIYSTVIDMGAIVWHLND